MVLHANRRWLCLLIALLFAIGSTGHVYAMTDMAMKMTSAAMESSAPDRDMDCGGDKVMHVACIAMCATAVGILGEPVSMPLVVVDQEVAFAAELPPRSRGPSPEPHPPKH